MTLISKGKYYKKFDDVHKKIQILAFTRNMSFMHFQLHGHFELKIFLQIFGILNNFHLNKTKLQILP